MASDSSSVLYDQLQRLERELAALPIGSKKRSILVRDIERVKRALPAPAAAPELGRDERVARDELALVLGTVVADEDDAREGLRRIAALRNAHPRSWAALPPHLKAAEEELRTLVHGSGAGAEELRLGRSA